MRVLLLLVVLSGCGASPFTWMRDANRLAAGPLNCGRADVASLHHRGFTYDSIGCGRAMRQACRDQICEPVGEVSDANDAGHREFATRVAATYEVLDQHTAAVVSECGRGQTVGVTLLVSPQGEIQEAYIDPAIESCLKRVLGPLPSGQGTMMISRVFAQ